jgi:hypothetical protein
MYSQQIAWRFLDSDASFSFAPVGTDFKFGAAAMANPSLPSTACFPSAEADKTNHEDEALDFDVWSLPWYISVPTVLSDKRVLWNLQ